jgi:predicted ABC-type ATPase
VELAKQRIIYRVSKGGHGIPDEDVEKRYLETFKNLKIVLPMCNLASLYDNTKKFRRIAIYKDGIPIRISHSVPNWFQQIQ